jgi:hypothetical protein
MDITQELEERARSYEASGPSAHHTAALLRKAQAEIIRLRAVAAPFAAHDWMDAELEDDSCKLTRHSGPVTVGHWRKLRAALVHTESATHT